ncbi:MAG: transporter substrate-binding domain-containing protein [Spirochaetes bacterium]|nr:transporter substrate-binding domain-containing protein [Spirochaetota bacterium]
MKSTCTVLAALFLLTGSATAQKLTILTEISGSSQFLDADGTMKGSNYEIVRAMQKRLGDRNPIEVMPWARAYNMLETGSGTMLFSTTRTPEREPLFKWVGPIQVADWSFFAQKGSGIRINSLEDARKVKSIGTYKDDVREAFLIKNGFTNLDSATDNIQNVRKLLAGRIDLFISTNLGIGGTLLSAGARPDDVESVFVIQTAKLYLAFSKDIPDELVARWQTALDAMKKDGSFMKIYGRYYPGIPLPR